MKKFWAALAIVFVLAPFGSAHADTISVSQVIRISGVVPPMRNIVVDTRGAIKEITSNTPEDVTPKVYVDSLETGREAVLTPAIQTDYEHKIQGKDLHSTDLHFDSLPAQVAKARTPHWLSAISHISVLAAFKGL